MKPSFVGAMAIASFLAAGPARAVRLGFEPAAQSASVGSAVDVALVISGLAEGTAPSLSTFDLDVTFDSGILSFVDATFGDPVLGDRLDLAGTGAVTSATPAAASVNLFELSLDSPADLDALQPDAFTLATLRFDVVSAGVGALAIGINALGDANGDALAADVASAGVTGIETSVAEPASLWLLLAGWIAACARRVRERLCVARAVLERAHDVARSLSQARCATAA